MSLLPGHCLGSYEIVAAIGAGGMGEVYRARDIRLGRSVALKLLRANLAHQPGLRERFEREALAVSSLNHPYICTLYDVGRHDGAEFLVMELVDGETLAERLTRGPLPVDLAIRCAIQIGEALDHAHRRGITHRDLKPANIMLTPAGVKLLDFGVAKLRNEAVEATHQLNQALDGLSAMSVAATGAVGGTAEGVLVGTLEYMAPEQIQGQRVDERADIFALGAVIYEVVTGRRAFSATTPAAVFGAILASTPPPAREHRDVPPLLDLVIRHCLAKDPDERWQRVRDLLVPLRWLASQEPLAPPATPATRLRWRWAAGGLIAAGLAVAAAIWTVRGVSSPTTLPRVEVAPPAGYSFAGDLVPSLALSPDSRHIVFRARNESGTQLYVKHAGEFAPAPIAGTNGAHTPFFSPDSQWIGFLVNGRIFKVPVSGGTPQRVTDAPSLSPTSLGATWGVEGSIVFAAGAAGLMRVSDAGGVADELTTPNESRGEMAHVWPQFLPGGREVLFTVRTSGDEWRLAVLSLASGDWDYLPPAGEMVAPRYLPEARQLVYAQSGGLFAVPLDISRRRFTGSPVPLPEPIYTHAFTGITVAQFAVSDRGMLVFMSGDPPDWTLVSANRNREVRVLVERPRGYRYPRISPNGQHLAVIIEERRADVHVLDMRDIRGVARSLTRVGTNTTPVWMPDSRSLVFSSRRPGSKSYDVYSVPIDGGEATSLFERPGAQFPTGWARGGVLAFDELTNRTARDIWRWSAAQGAINVLGNDSNERAATFSLDSQWLAYVSNETGEDEVYVTEYPGPGRTERLSVTGGTEPVWSPVNPRELFYRKGNQLLSVTFRTDPVFRADPPSELLAGPYVLAPAELGRPNYDVSRDGQWFVLVRSQERSTTRLRVMHEWLRGE